MEGIGIEMEKMAARMNPGQVGSIFWFYLWLLKSQVVIFVCKLFKHIRVGRKKFPSKRLLINTHVINMTGKVRLQRQRVPGRRDV